MSYPIFRTTLDSFWRVVFERRFIWHFGKIPLLLSFLFVAASVIYFYSLGPENFIISDPSNEKNPLSISLYFYLFLILSTWIPSLLLTPLDISWIRYVAVGDTALEGRQSWNFGRTELRFIGGIILQLVYAVLVGLAAMLGMGIAGLLVWGLASLFNIDSSAPWIPWFVGVAIAIATAALVVVYSAVIFRWIAAWIPLAFGAPLDVKRAWRVTRGIGFRVVTVYSLISLVTFVPFAIFGFVFGPDVAVISQENLAALISIQFIQNFIFFPVSFFARYSILTAYAAVWQRSVEAVAEWPVEQYPLIKAVSYRASPEPQPS